MLFLIIGVVILLLWIISLVILSSLVLKPRILPYKEQYEREVAKGRIDEKAYQAARKTKFMLPSDYGYSLSCELLESVLSDNGNKIAVICHGFRNSKYSSLAYAGIFIRLGFRVLIYDHRNHGLSGKAYTSMGHYERQDLKKIIDWCYQNFGEDSIIITHGESMGAATVLSHLEIDNRVRGVIADCAYSDLKKLLKHQLRYYCHLPSFLIPPVSLTAYLRAGFWYGEVSPIRAVKKTNLPILFIHGAKDYYVPTSMSEEMYLSKPDNKELFIVPEAKHAQSILIDRKGYEKKVKEFIENYILK